MCKIHILTAVTLENTRSSSTQTRLSQRPLSKALGLDTPGILSWQLRGPGLVVIALLATRGQSIRGCHGAPQRENPSPESLPAGGSLSALRETRWPGVSTGTAYPELLKPREWIQNV